MTFANKTDKQVGKWHETENTNCHLPTLFSVWWANGVWAKVIIPSTYIKNDKNNILKSSVAIKDSPDKLD